MQYQVFFLFFPGQKVTTSFCAVPYYVQKLLRRACKWNARYAFNHHHALCCLLWGVKSNIDRSPI